MADIPGRFENFPGKDKKKSDLRFEVDRVLNSEKITYALERL